ncbi:MAG: phosphoserine phosphatase SerB [Candidatus Nanopelagicaceae bacterium]|nr:phosphoserine phosphatase SerB [Candidatus Nanopelagicaceae bacterium]
MSDQQIHNDAPPFTGLILLSGIDSPGITEALFSTLAPFSITVLDIEQMVIRERLILTVLISLNPAHAQAIETDLAACGEDLSVDIAVSFSHLASGSIGAKTGLLHVSVLGQFLLPSAIAAISGTLANHQANIERIYRTASYPITAFEFVVSGASQAEIRTALAVVTREHGVDIAVQRGGLMRWAKRLVLIDVDSTLIQQEVIELLAAKAGVHEAVKKITDSAMRGEIDFEESLKARVGLLVGLPESVIAQVRSDITLTLGARTLIRTLQRLGHIVAVVSGGFIEVIEPLLTDLGISLYRANSLEVIGGRLTGRIQGPVIDRAAKALALHEFAELCGVDMEQTIAIGDGANDLDMIAAAGLGIAFNAKPAVRAAADSVLTQPYLDSVLYLMGIAREDVEESDDQSRQA